MNKNIITKLKRIPKAIKGFLFKLLPTEVQQFYIWKYNLKTEDIDTGFDNFFSTHLNHEYKEVYAILDLKNHTLIAYKGKLCMYSNSDQAVNFYVDKGLQNNSRYEICKLDFSTNITKVYY